MRTQKMVMMVGVAAVLLAGCSDEPSETVAAEPPAETEPVEDAGEAFEEPPVEEGADEEPPAEEPTEEAPPAEEGEPEERVIPGGDTPEWALDALEQATTTDEAAGYRPDRPADVTLDNDVIEQPREGDYGAVPPAEDRPRGDRWTRVSLQHHPWGHRAIAVFSHPGDDEPLFILPMATDRSANLEFNRTRVDVTPFMWRDLGEELGLDYPVELTVNVLIQGWDGDHYIVDDEKTFTVYGEEIPDQQ